MNIKEIVVMTERIEFLENNGNSSEYVNMRLEYMERKMNKRIASENAKDFLEDKQGLKMEVQNAFEIKRNGQVKIALNLMEEKNQTMKAKPN